MTKQSEAMLFQEPEVLPPRGTKKPAKASAPAPAPNVGTNVATLEPRNMLSIIASAAANPLVDVAKMKELLAMQREIEQAEQVKAFNAAMIAARDAMPLIVKDRKNDHTKSRYATLENVSKQIDQIARRHGFGMSFGTDDSPLVNHHRIVCDLMHDTGHVRRYFVDLQADTAGAKGTSNKTPIQGVGSTISYGRRYLKLMMFDLTVVGEDNDGNRQREADSDPATTADVLITSEQEKILLGAINFCGVGLPRFCQKYKIEKVADLLAKHYEDALTACKNFKPKEQPK